jgi:hypothetical protein
VPPLNSAVRRQRHVVHMAFRVSVLESLLRISDFTPGLCKTSLGGRISSEIGVTARADGRSLRSETATMKMGYVNVAEEVESLEVPGLGLVSKGLRVRHVLHGAGVVSSIAKFGDDDHSIFVNFEEHGYKAVRPPYDSLQPA